MNKCKHEGCVHRTKNEFCAWHRSRKGYYSKYYAKQRRKKRCLKCSGKPVKWGLCMEHLILNREAHVRNHPRQGLRKCGLCHEQGHYKSTCLQNPKNPESPLYKPS